MPGITCPDCGQPIDDPSAQCPGCGCPPDELRHSGWHSSRSTEGSVDERFSMETGPAPPLPEQSGFFPVGPAKLALMSVCTLGLYQFFWAYQQWHRIRASTGERLSPFWRAFFAPLWNFSLFGRVQRAGAERGVPQDWNPILMALGYFVLQGTWRAPDPVWALALLSFVPLVMVQQTIVQINRATPAAEGPNDRYSGLNVFAIMVGGLTVLGLLLSIVFPAPA